MSLTTVSEFRFKLYPKQFDNTRQFYAELLEFPIIHEWNNGEDGRGVMFDTGSAIIELLSPDDAYTPVKGCDVSLEVADVWELWDRFKESDIVVFSLRDNDWGDTSFCIHDPEGFEITFFTKRLE